MNKKNSFRKFYFIFFILFSLWTYPTFSSPNEIDSHLATLVNDSFNNYYSKKTDIDLDSDYFSINYDSEPSIVILNNHPTNPYWMKNIPQLQWSNWTKFYSDNFYISNFKIKNKTPVVIANIFGWRGIYYTIVLLNNNELSYLKEMLMSNLTSDQLYKLISKIEISSERIFPTETNIAGIFRNIFQYKGEFYMILGDNIYDKTSFNITKIDTNPPKIIYEKVFPSFKYSKNLNFTEKLIYETSSLAKLDNKLHETYNNSRKYLTDEAGKNLQSEQINFLKERNTLKDIPAIEKIYKNRIKYLENKISLEENKPLIIKETDPNILKSLNGSWILNKYYEYNNIGTGEEYAPCYKIIFNYPYVRVLYTDGTYDDFKIIKSESISYYWIEYYFNKESIGLAGSAGGELRLPYYGTYNGITCISSSGKEPLYLGYSINEKGDKSFTIGFVHPLSLLDNLPFIYDGYTLKKNTSK
ncbi:hypothetical protein [Cetobacterium sp. SF1]|uniref:hypothetical protein n=1 Tax=Cetobacterium sp. SF1 TaxID=3417654 RepID=UPI003CE88EDD